MRPLLLGFAACALLGCSDAPPKATHKPIPPPAQKVEEAPKEVFVEHTVLAGQTLWDIKKSYGVPLQAILDANDMTRSDASRLSKGKVLKIPGVTEAKEVKREKSKSLEDLPPLEGAAYHRVAAGETMWDIAATYDKTVGAIAERNAFSDEDLRRVRSGQFIVIPGVEQKDIRLAEDAAPKRGLRHTVGSGETVWDLSRSFRVSVAELMSANGMTETQVQNLRAGSKIWIPGVGADAGNGRARRISKKQKRALAFAKKIGLGQRMTATLLLRGKPKDAWVKAAGRNRLPGTLKWPVSNGRFVRGYGAGEGGYHLAVDIVGKIGWNVRAAASGVVAYSDDKVPGYGNMVILLHPGGWITMYAHNSVNYVVPGEKVPAGAVIAELGSSGISRGPHVHFEFIYNRKNCDPVPLFRPGVRHKTRVDRKTAVWKTKDSRPESVRCGRRRHHPRSKWVIHEDIGQ